jgi:hypothetical protein
VREGDVEDGFVLAVALAMVVFKTGRAQFFAVGSDMEF